MTKVTCDKCESEVKAENNYPVTMRDQSFDLCINCAAEVQSFIEGTSA